MGHIAAMDMVCASLAFIDGLGGPEMMLIFVLVLVLFGGQKLPEFARGLGKSIREFKKAAAGVEEEFKRALEEDERKQAIAKLPAPAATTATPTTPATDAAGPAAPYHSDDYHNAEYHNDPYHTDDPSGGHEETKPAGASVAPVTPAPPAASAAGLTATSPVTPGAVGSRSAPTTAEQALTPPQPALSPTSRPTPVPPPAKTEGP
jgi:TatA/E family protein of Tat protein translocase